MTKTFKFENGDQVYETVTGFSGVITGTAFYLTGCTQHLITQQFVPEGKEPIALWYDEGRINFVKKHLTEEDVKGSANGCDILPSIGAKGN